MKRRITFVACIGLALALGVAGVLAWQYRQRRQTFYTDADSIRCPVDDALVRKTLWRPPLALPAAINTESDEYEARLSPDGGSMLFVRGKAGGNADIFIAERAPGSAAANEWTQPRPLLEINTPADELGPELSRDGRTLYFYSNRGGGIGGYDLWRSQRGELGWQPPENLGSSVNTEFGEYSPALALDGSAVYFSSDRRLSGRPRGPDGSWDATIRDNVPDGDFDLYAAAIAQGTVQAAAPVAELNTPYHEGTASFSPAGDFLYFSSNRPGGHGGFDLYRSRMLRGHLQQPENLGPDVNGRSNELDPALSQGGFALHFSSDRQSDASQDGTDAPGGYNVHYTTSREVFAEAAAGPGVDWASLWALFAPALLWLLLGLLGLLLMLASFKRLQSRTVSLLTRCLLASLMVHLALLIMLTFWQVTTTVADLIETGGGRRVILASSVGSEGSLSAQVRGGLTDVAIGGSSIEPVRAAPEAGDDEAAILARLEADSRAATDNQPLAEPEVREADAPPVALTERLDESTPERQAALDVGSPVAPSPTRLGELEAPAPAPDDAIAAKTTSVVPQVPTVPQIALRPDEAKSENGKSVAETPPAREAAARQPAVQVAATTDPPSALAPSAMVAAPRPPVPLASAEPEGSASLASDGAVARREASPTGNEQTSPDGAMARLSPSETSAESSQSVNRALDAQDAAVRPGQVLKIEVASTPEPASSVVVSAPRALGGISADRETTVQIAGASAATGEHRVSPTDVAPGASHEPTIKLTPSRAPVDRDERSVAALAGDGRSARGSSIEIESPPAVSLAAASPPAGGADAAQSGAVPTPQVPGRAPAAHEAGLAISGPALAGGRTAGHASANPTHSPAAGKVHFEPSSGVGSIDSAGTLASLNATASASSLPPAATQPAFGNSAGLLAANDMEFPSTQLSAPGAHEVGEAGGHTGANESSIQISGAAATGMSAGRLEHAGGDREGSPESVRLGAVSSTASSAPESSLAGSHGTVASGADSSLPVAVARGLTDDGPVGLASFPSSIPDTSVRVPTTGNQVGTGGDFAEPSHAAGNMHAPTQAARAQGSIAPGSTAETPSVRVGPSRSHAGGAETAASIATMGEGAAADAPMALVSSGTIAARPSVDSGSIASGQSMDVRLPGGSTNQEEAAQGTAAEESSRASLAAVTAERGSRRSGLVAAVTIEPMPGGVHLPPAESGPSTAPGPPMQGYDLETAGAASAAPPALKLPQTAAALGMPEPLAGLARDLRVPTDLAPVEASPYIHRSEEKRMEVIKKMGGSEQTEQAVAQALKWLAAHQSDDGRWAARRYDDTCSGCGGAAKFDTDVATTGLALLCFLAADHTHVKSGPYRENVQRGLDWMISQQKATGDWRGGETLYSHGIASIAASEALGMTRDPRLIDPVRLAIGFICDARNTSVGGWRYEPGQIGDTSVLGWQVMALISAKRAGVEVPDETLEGARRWIDLVSTPSQAGLYAYQPGQKYSPSMTAEGMYVLQLLGARQHEARMKGSADYIAQNPPRWDDEPNTYYWYYATLATFQHQGEPWEQWNGAVTAQLLANQRTSGPAAGSWDPVDNWSKIGGRIYQTAMCTLMLEVYYRYLPLYNVEH